jgi:hypothetical protein
LRLIVPGALRPSHATTLERYEKKAYENLKGRHCVEHLEVNGKIMIKVS